MSQKQYITTAIDYPNAPPHMGHVLEKVLADVAARWRCNLNVFFRWRQLCRRFRGRGLYVFELYDILRDARCFFDIF